MIHRRQAVPHPPSTDVRTNRFERIAPHTRQREWRSHSQRAVHQIPIGADQGQAHAVAAQPPQTKQPLDAGDPATADHNLERPNRDHAPDASSNCSLYRNTGRRHGLAQTAVSPQPTTAAVSCTGPTRTSEETTDAAGDKHRLRAAKGTRLAGSRDDRRSVCPSVARQSDDDRRTRLGSASRRTRLRRKRPRHPSAGQTGGKVDDGVDPRGLRRHRRRWSAVGNKKWHCGLRGGAASTTRPGGPRALSPFSLA